jgi:hypothetical protein
VRLPGAGVPQQHERLTGPDPLETGQGGKRGGRHRRGGSEVEVLEVLEAGEPGLGDTSLAAAGIPFGDLGSQQLGEEGAVGQVVTDRGLGELLVLDPHGGQAQCPAGLVDRETRGLLGDQGAHRVPPTLSRAS